MNDGRNVVGLMNDSEGKTLLKICLKIQHQVVWMMQNEEGKGNDGVYRVIIDNAKT